MQGTGVTIGVTTITKKAYKHYYQLLTYAFQ